MLEVKLNRAKLWKGVTEAVAALIDETYLVATPEGIELTAMDESHICLLSLTLPKAWWDGYECIETARVGLNLEDLVKIVKRANAGDAIVLKYDGNEKFQVQVKGRGTRTFSLRLVEIDEEKIPPTTDLDVDFGAKIALACGILDEAVKDAEIYQDTIEIAAKEDNRLTFTAEGEVGDMLYELDHTALESIEVTSPCGGVFSLAFLKNVLKMGDIAENVNLQIAQNAPVRAEFTIPQDGKEAVTTAIYWLAPRVEEDEESYEEE